MRLKSKTSVSERESVVSVAALAPVKQNIFTCLETVHCSELLKG